jgi:glutamyl-tRNA synthetase
MAAPYVGRFAPSPTGKMHLGVARTLLAAWLDARKNGGRIVLRIEDIDRPRVVPGAADAIQYDLQWLGLDWDAGPVFQLEREALYQAAIERLLQMGRIYACTCSRKDLVASAPHGPEDEGPRYPGTCRDRMLPVELASPQARAGRQPALRLRTEPGDRIEHPDLVFGPLDQDVFAAAGDFVVRRADGLWAYQLAVSVDDLEQGVTRIVRGSDLRDSTARQLLLRRLLDPASASLETLHVPLIRDPSGKRLAKRDGAAGIASRRERGEAPEAVIGVLGASLGLVPPGTATSALELVERWDPARLSRGDTVLDVERGS